MELPQELKAVIGEKLSILKCSWMRYYDLNTTAKKAFIKSQQWGFLLWDERSIGLAIREHRLDALKWLHKHKPLIFKAKMPEDALAINSRWEMLDFLIREHPKIFNNWSVGPCIGLVIKLRDLESFQKLFPIILEKYPDYNYSLIREVLNWGAGHIAMWLVDNYYHLTTPPLRDMVKFLREYPH